MVKTKEIVGALNTLFTRVADDEITKQELMDELWELMMKILGKRESED